MPVYHTDAPSANTQSLPTSLTVFDVRRLLSEVPTATVEVGPSTHPTASWNRLHLGDATYITMGSRTTWQLECSCVLPEQSCPACRAAVRKASRRTIHNA